jgi:60 kDa SS-A/Ro ribonucleoprotein
MANKSLFSSASGLLPRADSVNEAGGLAYGMPPKQALAQLAATGCFQGTYYAGAEVQLGALLALAEQVDDAFLAKMAVYGRERAFLKDMPAALLLVLSRRDRSLFHQAFDRVVDNGRVLRTLLQMIRSGQCGRHCLSYSLRRAFRRWLNGASVGQLLSASIGKDPSLRDILRLARPTPPDDARRALFGWLAERPVEAWAPATAEDLPMEVRALNEFRAAGSEAEQVEVLSRVRLRWDLLADAARGPSVWKAIARQMRPQALRMNLNTLLRHGVFDDPELAELVARRVADEDEIRRSRQFPYQFLAAYLNADEGVPAAIKAALGEAAEMACGSVPVLAGPVVIGLDVSGSMHSPVTGHRGEGGTTQVRCIDVAALFAAAVLRRNPDSLVIPFDDHVHHADLDPGSPILQLAERLARFGGGGTDCSSPLKSVNRASHDRRFVGCILVSDNMSWIGVGRFGSTAVMSEWQRFVRKQARRSVNGSPGPKLVCLDIQPYGTTQAPERSDILNVGGFSDAVFSVVSSFLGDGPARFVAEVEAIEL